MNLHQDFKMVKQVLIEQQWMFDKMQKQGKEMEIQWIKKKKVFFSFLLFNPLYLLVIPFV